MKEALLTFYVPDVSAMGSAFSKVLAIEFSLQEWVEDPWNVSEQMAVTFAVGVD